jgi:hypothetical protein
MYHVRICVKSYIITLLVAVLTLRQLFLALAFQLYLLMLGGLAAKFILRSLKK